MTPHLDNVSLEFFESVLQNTQIFLEYGCGGSTIRALELGVETVITAESDPFWADKVRKEAEAIMKPNQSLHIELIDFGSIGNWGTPTNPTEGKALEYVERIWDKADSLSVTPSAILIDGRFRVACGCESLLRCGVGTLIMLDDAFRESYTPFRKLIYNYQTYGRLLSFSKEVVVDTAVRECKQENILSKD